MEEEQRNRAAVEEEVKVGNGALRARYRRKRLLEKEGEDEGDAAVESHMGVEHVSSVYLDTERGFNSLDGTKGTEVKEGGDLLAGEDMQDYGSDSAAKLVEKIPFSEKHTRKNLKDELKPSSEVEGGIMAEPSFFSQVEEIALSNDKKPVIEMDLEQILGEQETHDLYCPNCHSCITKRVILRKRKRTSSQNTLDTKRGKSEPRTEEETVVTHDTEEPDLFRCLSCLSFFIPTGTGFRLFKMFTRRGGNENVQGSQQVPERSQSWIFSLFETKKNKTKESILEKPLLAEPTDVYESTADYSERTEQNMNTISSLTEEMLPIKDQNEIKVEIVDIHKNNVADVMENIKTEVQQAEKNIVDTITGKKEYVDESSVKYVSISLNQENSVTEKIEIEKVKKMNVFSREDDEDIMISVPEGPIEDMEEKSEYLERPSENDPSIVTQMTHSPEICVDTQIHVEQTGQTHQWDVLKAIVYGGLVESIASLGVISSAAGSGGTTLQVISLGLANLVSGLLVLIHNLVELKNEQYKSIGDNTDEESDRYWELLGRKGHIRLHATVALISYILVGIIPPILYGFSFRKSDNKEYKLIVVAGASLLCITLLAIAKAHVQEGRKRYIQTLAYYVGLGVSGSGLSYALGMLIKMLLQKLGLFVDHTSLLSPPSSSILERGPAISW